MRERTCPRSNGDIQCLLSSNLVEDHTRALKVCRPGGNHLALLALLDWRSEHGVSSNFWSKLVTCKVQLPIAGLCNMDQVGWIWKTLPDWRKIPSQKEETLMRKKEWGSSQCHGILVLVTSFCFAYAILVLIMANIPEITSLEMIGGQGLPLVQGLLENFKTPRKRTFARLTLWMSHDKSLTNFSSISVTTLLVSSLRLFFFLPEASDELFGGHDGIGSGSNMHFDAVGWHATGTLQVGEWKGMVRILMVPTVWGWWYKVCFMFGMAYCT